MSLQNNAFAPSSASAATLERLDLDGVLEACAHALESDAAIFSVMSGGRRRIRAAFGAPNLDTDAGAALCAKTMGGVRLVRAGPTRMARDPLFQELPHFKSYFAAPVRLDGAAIGALAVLDRRPRRRTARQERSLQLFAQICAELLQQRLDAAFIARLDHLRETVERRAGIGFWRNDLQTGAVDWTPGMIGLVGQPAQALSPGDHRPRDAGIGALAPLPFPEAYQRTMAPAPVSLITTFVDQGGGEKHIRLVGAPQTDGSGCAIAMQGAAIDETPLVRALGATAGQAERLADWVDAAPVALAMFDRDMRYLRVSPQWIADYGLTNQVLLGRTHYEVFPEIPDRWRSLHQRCLGGETLSHPGEEFPRADGTSQWIAWEIWPWRNTGGEIAGIVMCTRDQTRELAFTRELSRMRERVTLALDSGGMVVWELDLHSGQLFIDGDPAAALGLERADLSNWRAALACAHPDDRPALAAAWRKHVAEEAPFRVELRTHPKTGAPRWALSVAKARKSASGAVTGAVGLVLDITARKEYALALAAAKDAAEQAGRVKANFLATISHEIRTPLHGVLGMADGLKQTALTPHQANLVNAMSESGTSLLALMNDLLDIASIEAGELRIEERAFELDDMLRPILAAERARATAKGLRFLADIDASARGGFRGDPLRISQILFNLIGNAIKFTDAGEVRVSARCETEAGSPRLIFTVQDTGVGFAPSERARLFQRFEQGAVRRGGAGLGMAISAALAQRMGGEIDCASTPGQGSTFWVALPLPRSLPIERQSAPLPATAAPERRIHVLCAEDHPVNRMIVDIALEDAGVALRFAENGREAVDAARVEDFDIILMDLAMPDMGGIDAARAIRALEAQSGRPRRPILALTAHDEAAALAQDADGALDGVVMKPFTAETLITAMLRALDGDAPSSEGIAAAG
ncbi:MAG: PAS domain-containing protein [Alphaproteobacteria bacterium]|nr:PAS domain-containing protein [Alphaproteobacteria bacterium]